MKRQPWSDQDIDRLTREYPDAHTPTLAKAMGRTDRGVYAMANLLGLVKSAAYLASPLAGRTDGKRGATARFRPGHVTWNKGLNRVNGDSETRFRPGSMPKNWRPIGSERIDTDGYLERKVSDTRRKSRDWVRVHVLTWMERNGPVPNGHAVVFCDGNKQNIVYENLELISRADLMRRNTAHNYPPELKRVMRLKASLTRKINEHNR